MLEGEIGEERGVQIMNFQVMLSFLGFIVRNQKVIGRLEIEKVMVRFLKKIILVFYEEWVEERKLEIDGVVQDKGWFVIGRGEWRWREILEIYRKYNEGVWCVIGVLIEVDTGVRNNFFVF